MDITPKRRIKNQRNGSSTRRRKDQQAFEQFCLGLTPIDALSLPQKRGSGPKKIHKIQLDAVQTGEEVPFLRIQFSSKTDGKTFFPSQTQQYTFPIPPLSDFNQTNTPPLQLNLKSTEVFPNFTKTIH